MLFRVFVVQALIVLCLMIMVMGCTAGFEARNSNVDLASLTVSKKRGIAIYENTCARCHGSLDNSSKRNRSAAHITAALATVPQMGQIQLTPADIMSVASALKVNSCTPDNSVEGSPIQRITHVEYENSIRDYFGLNGSYTTGFRADPVSGGFRNNGHTLTVDLLQLKDYLSSAEKITDDINTQARGFIFTCSSGSGCASSIFARVATNLFREPVFASDQEITSLIQKVYDPAIQNGDSFEQAVYTGIQALILSPKFLFHIYAPQRPDDPTNIEPLNDFELAERLASFLWSSLPDQQLMNLAQGGQLRSQLSQQALRMLQDPRSINLVQNFSFEWMKLNKLDIVSPDPALFPSFSNSIQSSMKRESELFLENLWKNDESMLDILDANYSYLNDELARHYSLPPTNSSQFQKVDLTGSNRVGMLTHGSVLTFNSKTDRTSIIARGYWVLENILCDEPPPPPDDVPELPPIVGDSKREILESHRSSPACYSCHSMMDPIGFGLENFDAIGTWRTEYTSGVPVDNLGELPTGETFNGVHEMLNVIKADGRFPYCATSKLMTYALGRETKNDENCRALENGNQTVSDQGRFSETILSTVLDPSFTNKRGGSH